MRSVFKVLLFVQLLYATPASAQTADLEFDRALLAHGGAALGAVRTIRITGQSTTKEGVQPITLSASIDGELRIDYGNPVTRSRVTDAEGTFEERNGERKYSSAHDGLFATLDWFSVLGIRHFATGLRRTSLGSSAIIDRPTRKVRAATGLEQSHYDRTIQDEVDVDFDVETGFVAAISRRQFSARSLDHPFVLTTAFSDYRHVGDMVLPYAIGRSIGGNLRETITVDSIEINPSFTPGIFER